MKRLLALLFLGLLSTGAFAADNTVIMTPGSGVTMKSKDIGLGVQAMQPILSDTGGNALSTPTTGADGASNTATGLQGYTRPSWWNGATWDRAPGDLTNGAFVNVKTSVLPTGASTATNQTTINTSIGTTNTTLTSTNTKLDTIITNTGAAIPAQSSTIPIGGTSLCDGANGATNPCTTAATVKAASTAAVAADKALVVGLSPNGATPALANAYPFGAIPLTASATGTTAATTATLAGAIGKTTYICSLSVRANATANTNVTDTVTGVITGTLSRALWVPANTAGLGVDEQIYSPCVPASTTNTAIAVVSGAPGTGGVVTVNATGYQL